FTRHGLMSERTVLRNLLQDARQSPEFLRERADAGTADAQEPIGVAAGEPELDAQGRPWRIIVRDDESGVISHTDFLDLEGNPVLRVPYVTGRADWHQAPIQITVFGADGAVAGHL